MIRFGVYFATTGAAVPFIFFVINVLLDRYHLSASGIADFVWKLQLLLWPSSIFMMATAGRGITDWFTVQVVAISVTVNAVLYLLVGASIWVGIHKDARWLLFVVPGAILWGWYKLLHL